MGFGRDTSNVFSTLVLLVLTSSECVCRRLGEMARGQAGVMLVQPSGSVQFKVEPCRRNEREGVCVSNFAVSQRHT